MAARDDDVVDLATAPTEIEARTIAAALREEGIHAEVFGGALTGLRAETPTLARVVVRRAELDRARSLLAQIRRAAAEIDWDQVDVGEPEGGIDVEGKCYACGYSMEGLDNADRCPECGQWLRPGPDPDRTAPAAAPPPSLLKAAARWRRRWVLFILAVAVALAGLVAAMCTLTDFLHSRWSCGM